MKRISSADAQKINDFALESAVSLPAYVLEKDMHVYDAMKILVSLPANPLFKLVFCGGTCLSKAYDIVERMSEDIDFKVVPTQVALGLSKTKLRVALRAFRHSVILVLQEGGFTGDGAVTARVKDEGAYCAITVVYESAFEKPESLRAHLLIEMSYTPLANPTESRSIGLLLERLISGSYSRSFKMECVSLHEALAEKLISFPRRLGKHMADQLPHGCANQKTFDDQFLTDELQWDKALIRHLFDVRSLLAAHPELMKDLPMFGGLLATVIKKDALDFKNSHADYINDPAKELQAAMDFAKDSPKLRSQYETFVRDMVYGSHVPSYSEAVHHFYSVLKSALQSPSLKASLAAGEFIAPQHDIDAAL